MTDQVRYNGINKYPPPPSKQDSWKHVKFMKKMFPECVFLHRTGFNHKKVSEFGRAELISLFLCFLHEQHSKHYRVVQDTNLSSNMRNAGTKNLFGDIIDVAGSEWAMVEHITLFPNNTFGKSFSFFGEPGRISLFMSPRATILSRITKLSVIHMG